MRLLILILLTTLLSAPAAESAAAKPVAASLDTLDEQPLLSLCDQMATALIRPSPYLIRFDEPSEHAQARTTCLKAIPEMEKDFQSIVDQVSRAFQLKGRKLTLLPAEASATPWFDRYQDLQNTYPGPFTIDHIASAPNVTTLYSLECAKPKSKDLKSDEDAETRKTREENAWKVIKTYNQNSIRVRFRPGFKDCGLTDVEIAAIFAYTGHIFQKVNEDIRKESGDKYKDYIATTQRALNKLAPFKGQVVKRGITKSEAVEKLLTPLRTPGTRVTFKEFTSTSLTQGFNGNYHLEITPCGQNAHYIAPLSDRPAEEEVLFQPNTEFKSKGYTPNPKTDSETYQLEELCP